VSLAYVSSKEIKPVHATLILEYMFEAPASTNPGQYYLCLGPLCNIIVMCWLVISKK
jgi:hypothetical protein